MGAKYACQLHAGWNGRLGRRRRQRPCRPSHRRAPDGAESRRPHGRRSSSCRHGPEPGEGPAAATSTATFSLTPIPRRGCGPWRRDPGLNDLRRWRARVPAARLTPASSAPRTIASLPSAGVAALSASQYNSHDPTHSAPIRRRADAFTAVPHACHVGGIDQALLMSCRKALLFLLAAPYRGVRDSLRNFRGDEETVPLRTTGQVSPWVSGWIRVFRSGPAFQDATERSRARRSDPYRSNRSSE